MTDPRPEPPKGPAAPAWLQPLAAAAAAVRPEQLSRFLPPEEGGRASAVLMLFGELDAPRRATALAVPQQVEGEAGHDVPVPPPGDVLLIERAHDMRSHAGQVAFPGGAVDPDDEHLVAAALREAQEETGLDPAGVDVLTELPALFLPPSGFVVTPVLAWWRAPTPVSVVDEREVASVHRVPLAELLDPANRLQVTHPSGYVGPAFTVAGLLVWGFTAGLIDRMLRLAGWEQPWDRHRHMELPPHMLGAGR
jgi:8-oxo-dGTP pyrophosphatase MutT (NUDIX family)